MKIKNINLVTLILIISFQSAGASDLKCRDLAKICFINDVQGCQQVKASPEAVAAYKYYYSVNCIGVMSRLEVASLTVSITSILLEDKTGLNLPHWENR